MSETQPIWYEFRSAVYNRDYPNAMQILRKNPNIISMKNGLGETTLHFLAVENDQEGVAWLFSKEAELNTKNTFGEPLIFEVAQLGYKELFVWFVENGVDLQIKGRKAESLIEFLIKHKKEEMADWVQTILSNRQG